MPIISPPTVHVPLKSSMMKDNDTPQYMLHFSDKMNDFSDRMNQYRREEFDMSQDSNSEKDPIYNTDIRPTSHL